MHASGRHMEPDIIKAHIAAALEAAFAALKWEIWEILPKSHRADVRNEEWADEIRRRLSEHLFADYDHEQRYVRRRE